MLRSSSSRAKTAYLLGRSIEHLLNTRSGLAVFATFTFRENVEDKKEAGARWRRLKERLRRSYPGIRGVGVWQRQKRGAWHIHMVFDRYLDIGALREDAVACGWGPMLNLRVIHDGGSVAGSVWSRRRVVNYMLRYLVRDMDTADKGVRLVEYFNSRIGSASFAWVRGFARVWRAGRQMYSDMFGGPVHWRDRDFILRLGMEALGEEGRARVLEESDAVAAWWNPEAYPF